MILAKRHDINPPSVDGSGVPAASKSHVAIRAVRSSSPKAGSSHIDNEKTVAEGQLLRVHNDSDCDDQVNTSLDICQHHHLLRNEENYAIIRMNTTSLFKLSISSKLCRKRGNNCTGRKRKTETNVPGRGMLSKEFLDVLKK